MLKPGVIAIVGEWLLVGFYAFVTRRNKPKAEKDVCSSPLIILVWPVLTFILSPAVAVALFLPVFGTAWAIDWVGARFGLPYAGDAAVLCGLLILGVVARARARARERARQNNH